MPNTHPFLKSFGLAACLIIPIIAITATSGADPAVAGEQAGALAVGPLLAGVAVGIWAHRAAHRWRVLDYVLRFAVCTLVFAALHGVGRTALSAIAGASPSAPVSLALTEDEKQSLSLSGGWVHGGSFDYVFAVGNKFSLAPDIQSEMNQQLVSETPSYAWALQHENDNEIILVLVTKGVGDKQNDFRAYTRGIDKGIRPRADRILENEFRWDRQTHDFRHGAQLSNGVYLRTRCRTSGPYRKQPPYIVCVQTLSPDSTGLQRVLAYLEVKSWRWEPSF